MLLITIGARQEPYAYLNWARSQRFLVHNFLMLIMFPLAIFRKSAFFCPLLAHTFYF